MSGRDASELTTIAGLFADAEKRGDVEALDQLLAPEYLAVEANGAYVPRASVLARARTQAEAKIVQTREIRELYVRTFGDAGIVRGVVELRGVRDGVPVAARFRFTDVWIRRDGAWSVAGTQRTKVAQGVT